MLSTQLNVYVSYTNIIFTGDRLPTFPGRPEHGPMYNTSAPPAHTSASDDDIPGYVYGKTASRSCGADTYDQFPGH